MREPDVESESTNITAISPSDGIKFSHFLIGILVCGALYLAVMGITGYVSRPDLKARLAKYLVLPPTSTVSSLDMPYGRNGFDFWLNADIKAPKGMTVKQFVQEIGKMNALKWKGNSGSTSAITGTGPIELAAQKDGLSYAISANYENAPVQVTITKWDPTTMAVPSSGITLGPAGRVMPVMPPPPKRKAVVEAPPAFPSGSTSPLSGLGAPPSKAP